MVEIVPAVGVGQVPGSVVVLSCPPALCLHLEFAVADVLGVPVSLHWSPQPARPGMVYAAGEWRATSGTAGRLASRLRRLGPVCFEVVEGPARGVDAERYVSTPELGLHRTAIAANGDSVVSEHQLRDLLDTCSGGEMPARLRRLLGQPWDDALEPLRRAGDGAPVTWLRRTG